MKGEGEGAENREKRRGREGGGEEGEEKLRC